MWIVLYLVTYEVHEYETCQTWHFLFCSPGIFTMRFLNIYITILHCDCYFTKISYSNQYLSWNCVVHIPLLKAKWLVSLPLKPGKCVLSHRTHLLYFFLKILSILVSLFIINLCFWLTLLVVCDNDIYFT